MTAILSFIGQALLVLLILALIFSAFVVLALCLGALLASMEDNET